MTGSPWLSIAIVWVVALIVAALLWQRFTRVPMQPSSLSSRTPSATRRVVPLWLALVWLIVLGVALWLTIRLARGG